jgi:glycosyltransferase involved in cell wall biosynthesis
MIKNIFYLREIERCIDSGMSLQVINDYGNLARSNNVYVPINYSKRKSLRKYLENEFPGTHLEEIELTSKSKHFRRISMFISLIMRLKEIDIIIIRERKHLRFAKIIQKISNVPIASELHEGGLPLTENHVSRKFQEYLDHLDGILFTTPAQVKYLQDNDYYIPNKTCILPNGVNIKKLSGASQLPIKDPFRIITYTGQFSSWKNIPLLFF